jgi:hypothetical protein
MTTNDELDRLRIRLQHPYIRERKQALAEAKALLATTQERATFLDLLAAVARDDIAPSVRELAQAILDAESKATTPFPASEAQHMFPVQCPRCQHITYFDKRRVCGATGKIKRTVKRGGIALDELLLTCEYCYHEMTHAVDCEGYK